MKRIIFCIFFIVQGINSHPVLAGAWSSGGGDPLRFTFIEGKAFAHQMVSRLDFGNLKKVSSPQVVSWLKSHQASLKDILSHLEMVWTDESYSTCAWTEFRPGAVVTLSFKHCRSITSKDEAARLLIHEAAHQLGVADEQQADQIALGVYRAWKRMLLQEIPLCEQTDLYGMNQRMTGKWRIDFTMAGQLGWNSLSGLVKEVEFIQDHSVLKHLSGIGRCAIDSGYVKVASHRVPYVLAFLRGGIVLIQVRSNSAGQQDLEYSTIQFVRGREPKDDLIYLGGDTFDTPSIPLRKVH